MDKVGHNGSITDAVDLSPDTFQPAAAWRKQELDKKALQWVHAALPALSRLGQQQPLPGATTVQGAFSLPQDIRQLSTGDLITAGAATPKHPWLVVAGWPCQDLSQAGTGAGLQDAPHNMGHDDCPGEQDQAELGLLHNSNSLLSAVGVNVGQHLQAGCHVLAIFSSVK